MPNHNDLKIEITARRYPSVMKARKNWICHWCQEAIIKGDDYEHSWTADREREIKLHLKCAGGIKKR